MRGRVCGRPHRGPRGELHGPASPSPPARAIPPAESSETRMFSVMISALGGPVRQWRDRMGGVWGHAAGREDILWFVGFFPLHGVSGSSPSLHSHISPRLRTQTAGVWHAAQDEGRGQKAKSKTPNLCKKRAGKRDKH